MSPGVDEQRWLPLRGYDGRVVRVESQLDVAGRRRRIVDIKTEEDRRKYSTLSHTNPHATTSGCGCLDGLFELLTDYVV